MDIRQLQYFAAAARADSFSKAAERMHVSQSALGSQIRGLEQELGAVLFERHSRGTELTPIGRSLMTHAEEIIRRVRLARSEIRTSQDHADCNVVIGMTPSVAAVIAIPLLDVVGQKHPDLKISIVEEKSLALIEKVASCELTLALCFNSHHAPGVRWEPVLEEHLFFVESAAFGKLNGGVVELAEVARHRLALPGMPASVRGVIESAAAAEKLGLSITYTVNSTSIMRALVFQKAAASIMPYGAVRDQVLSGEFIAKEILPPVYRELYFLTSDKHQRGRGARVVKRELQILLKNEEMCRSAGWQPLRDREGAISRAYTATMLQARRPGEADASQPA